MDPANDNPLKRFPNFWLGLVLFAAFGLASLVLGIGFKRPIENSFDKINEERRVKIKRESDKAHAGTLEAAQGGFSKVGARFLETAPAAVEKPEFAVGQNYFSGQF